MAVAVNLLFQSSRQEPSVRKQQSWLSAWNTGPVTPILPKPKSLEIHSVSV